MMQLKNNTESHGGDAEIHRGKKIKISVSLCGFSASLRVTKKLEV